MKIAFTNANIIDITEKNILKQHTILVDDGMITAISPNIKLDGYDQIDLHGNFLTPGIFNCHTHMMSIPFGIPLTKSAYLDSKTGWVLVALKHLEDYIKTGVTFVRDVAGLGDPDDLTTLILRDAVKDGLIKMAPDIQTSGHSICMTGGSTWCYGGIQVDGETESRKATRLMIRSGVDWIKLMATGGTATLGNKCSAEQLTLGELKAAVEEAHKAGLKVACHAQGIEGAWNTIHAGADCMEHGFVLTDEAIEKMVEQDMWLVPTLMASYSILKYADETTPSEYIEKAKINVENVFRTFPKAYQQGVHIALGTDCGSPLCKHDNSCEEMVLMVEHCGLTPWEALTIGTINSAKLCNVDHEMGSIEIGKKANFAVFEHNPTENIRATLDCTMTIKNGEILWNKEVGYAIPKY